MLHSREWFLLLVDVDVKTHNVLRNARLLNTWWLPGAMRNAPPLSSSRRRFNRRVPSRTSSYGDTSAQLVLVKTTGLNEHGKASVTVRNDIQYR